VGPGVAVEDDLAGPEDLLRPGPRPNEVHGLLEAHRDDPRQRHEAGHLEGTSQAGERGEERRQHDQGDVVPGVRVQPGPEGLRPVPEPVHGAKQRRVEPRERRRGNEQPGAEDGGGERAEGGGPSPEPPRADALIPGRHARAQAERHEREERHEAPDDQDRAVRARGRDGPARRRQGDRP
jgi:hypothetical protein